jgi:hypothetical protein
MKPISFVVMSLCLLFAASGVAGVPGEDEATIELHGGQVKVHYGTPSLGGRNLDEMVKPGMAWRMGMNNPTTLETSVALDFDGTRLPAGKYTLFAQVNSDSSWTLLVSSSASPMLDPSTVVLKSPMHFTKEAQIEDPLKIKLEKAYDGAALTVAWGAYRLHGGFKPAE